MRIAHDKFGGERERERERERDKKLRAIQSMGPDFDSIRLGSPFPHDPVGYNTVRDVRDPVTAAACFLHRSDPKVLAPSIVLFSIWSSTKESESHTFLTPSEQELLEEGGGARMDCAVGVACASIRLSSVRSSQRMSS